MMGHSQQVSLTCDPLLLPALGSGLVLAESLSPEYVFFDSLVTVINGSLTLIPTRLLVIV